MGLDNLRPIIPLEPELYYQPPLILRSFLQMHGKNRVYKQLKFRVMLFLQQLFLLSPIYLRQVIMLLIGMHVSLLAGIITVGLLIVPIVARTMDEVIRQVPNDLKEAAFSLGATKWETSIKVILKQALPGLATASLLGFGRAIGDAASVMFTTGFTDNIPHSINDPAATLPLAIFFQLSSPIAEVRDRAYAAALILTIIIFGISLLSRLLIKKFSKNTI